MIISSVKSKYGGDSAPRTSLFVNFGKGEVVVVRWDSKLEEFSILGRDDASPYVKSVKEFHFDANLGVYPAEEVEKWQGLSNHISASLVARLQPIGAHIAASGKMLTNEERRQIDEAMEEMGVEDSLRTEEIEKFSSERQCYYTTVPKKQVLPKGSTPAQITALHMDKSPILETMISNSYGNNSEEFIGEVQFSFVCFLLGQSFESFEQWKSLLILALGCESAVYDPKRTSFWLDFLQSLRCQLIEAPEDFFIDVVEGNNFLHHSLCDFFEITKDPCTPEILQEEIKSFHDFVEDRFGIPFDDGLDY